MLPIILTSDKTSWALRPQCYLLRKYWPGISFTIGGYTQPGFGLCGSFYHIGRFEDYPVDRWSNGLLDFLEAIKDDVILFMMDDYWPIAPVNVQAVEWLAGYITERDDIARLDLTGDRFYASGWLEAGNLNGIDLIRSDPQSLYHFSYQAALWRRNALMACVAYNESPWLSEMSGEERLQKLGLSVIGTKQPPLKYLIASQQGNITLDGGYQGRAYALPDEDRDYIEAQHWIMA